MNFFLKKTHLFLNSYSVHRAPKNIVNAAMTQITIRDQSNRDKSANIETLKLEEDEARKLSTKLANLSGKNTYEVVKFTMDALML
jgi:hypothetical protein